MSPDEPAQPEPASSKDGGADTDDSGRWASEVWQHAIDDTDIVVGGVVHDGNRWESDGEGGVRPRLSGDDWLARERDEADAEQRLYELREAADADFYGSEDLGRDEWAEHPARPAPAAAGINLTHLTGRESR
ncbi:hypothetical protein ACFO1B_44070 [Dactylosporangium siamense]|uniref:Uncharacterized protein n=1 Tax=Dactylosporangium siamense TaxID=685454 RepID=A0A919PYU0_9ACTN|nr:hypothetical protein [Dactylosporangium siamense]GIG52912.1 hypothetical protein Dsi01nite_109530 [Dactylosporangium siamense]